MRTTPDRERDAAYEVCKILVSMGEEDFDLQVFNEAYVLARKVVEGRIDKESLMYLIEEWDKLRSSYMNAGIDIDRKAEMSRIAAAYEYCADGLRKALGMPPRWT